MQRGLNFVKDGASQMSNQPKEQQLSRTSYTKPTLTEYGSLAEQTRMFDSESGSSERAAGMVVHFSPLS